MLPKRSAVTLAAFPARPFPWGELLFPVAVLVAITMFVATRGWLAGLSGFDDPDSSMRLVEVREFLAGKGWFDLLETRLGPAPGVFMHWSRLIDLPIAGLILAFDPFVGRPSAELLAVNLWPPLTFLLFGAGVVATVRRFADGFAAAVALVLIVASPVAIGVFAPGRIDHHNAQAALLVWMLAALVRADRSARAAAMAGVLAATSVAIGLEMLPLILVATAVPALAWIHDGDRWRRSFSAYGLALAAATAVFFLLGVGPARWTVAACDQISPVYLVLAAVGGLGTAVVTRFLRGGASAGIGCAMVTVTALAFPNCLAGPYADVDPRLGPIWLDNVIEAWSVADVARRFPWELPGKFAGPIVALVLAIAAAATAKTRRVFGPALLATCLAGAIALALSQQRGLVAADVLAAIAAAVATVVIARDGLGAAHPAAALLRNAWILVAPLPWAMAGDLAADRTEQRLQSAAAVAATDCMASIGDTIAALPAGMVVAPGNYGAYLLMQTRSSVLAAPYHRNTEGLLTADAILTADDGRRLFDAAGARYLAICPHDVETVILSRRAPHGLAARLASGERPDWLEVVADDPKALVLTRRTDVPAPLKATPVPDITGTLAPPRLRSSLDWAGQPQPGG